ncbi:DUF4097 domain-containing protein [Luteimonas gilva]|uniref:DUF4097 domain-containing protein n=2 Tax=Luteimonas gilva TaxID=2572684 RepID=A0A4V5ZQS4_9GAMM|nr:DUF4097 domain-containing protein [Luteimonas gilva]
MLSLLALPLLAIPVFAQAAEQCKYGADRNLALNLSGVRTVVVRTGPYDFNVKSGSAARASGRACASSQEGLDRLQLVQKREGDRLIIETGDRKAWSGGWFNGYSSFDVDVTLPKNVALEMDVGSGDGDVSGIANVDAHVGSGDLSVSGADRLTADVGSGDLKVSDIGQLQIEAVGSGEFEGDRIRGDVRIGTIGSGDVDLRQVGGSVDARSIGSGDLSAVDIDGGLRVAHVGSGGVNHRDVKGRVDVPEDD